MSDHQLANSVSELIENLKAALVHKAFMFVDLFNSTEFKVSRPDTAWVPEVGKFYELTAESIAAHGGTIVKFLGDGVMVIFDHAENALQAAIDLQERLSVKRRHNTTELRCKIGITLGEAYQYQTGDGRHDYLGTSVDIAARLCGLAHGNAILLSEDVYLGANVRSIYSTAGAALERTTADYFGEPEEKDLKGIKNPVKYYVLFWQASQEGYATTQPVAAAAETQSSSTSAADPGAEPGSVVAPGDRGSGTVSRILDGGAYGFIREHGSSEASEIFFHRSSLVQATPIQVGSPVSFRLEIDDHERRRAASVIVLGNILSGKVTRFNPEKYGFLAVLGLDGERLDAFMPASEVEDGVRASDTVSFVVDLSDKGLVARKVRLGGQGGEAGRVAQLSVGLELDRTAEGVVAYFNADKGFGFIACEGNRVFVHRSELADGETDLFEGDLVVFVVAPGRHGGYSAQRVEILEEASQAA